MLLLLGAGWVGVGAVRLVVPGGARAVRACGAATAGVFAGPALATAGVGLLRYLLVCCGAA